MFGLGVSTTALAAEQAELDNVVIVEEAENSEAEETIVAEEETPAPEVSVKEETPAAAADVQVGQSETAAQETTEEAAVTEEAVDTEEAEAEAVPEYLDTVKNGWDSENGSWFYYKDGEKQTGWVDVNGRKYYMSAVAADHHMITGLATIGGSKYYFGGSGAMQTGWKQISGAWYYFNTSGTMQSGWQQLKWSGGTDYFYFNSDGKMATSTTVGGYKVDANGARVTESAADTKAQNGWVKDGNKWFYYKDGTKQSGWVDVNGKKYYMSAVSADRHMITGLATIGGSKYYFGGSGAMQTGWKTIDGAWYYFNTSGTMQSGWQQLKWSGGTDYFYFNSDGKMAVSTTVGEYKVDANGARVTAQDSSKQTAVDRKMTAAVPSAVEEKTAAPAADDTKNSAQNGWVESGNRWFYYENDKKVTGWVEDNGNKYYLSVVSGDGHRITDWATIDGKKYYFDANGAMATGTKVINGTTYVFGSNGVLQSTSNSTSSKETGLTDNQKFIRDIAAYVQEYAPQYGISVNSPVIAQAIWESGWGKSKLASQYHNYFGLTTGGSWKGESVKLSDNSLTFRAYSSMEEGVKGYFEFINFSRYANLKGVTDPKEYLQRIQDDGYCGGEYASTLYKFINSNNLTQFD